MTPLNEKDNQEKATLLNQFFPDEMPKLIDFILGMCEAIKDSEELNRKQWQSPLFDFDYWISLLEKVQIKINREKNMICKNEMFFSEQLFSGYTGVFTIHCTLIYTSTINHPNKKFSQAVDLFFN